MEEGRFRFLKVRAFKSVQNKEYYILYVLDLLDFHVEQIFITVNSYKYLCENMNYNDVIDSRISFVYNQKDKCYKIAFNNII